MIPPLTSNTMSGEDLFGVVQDKSAAKASGSKSASGGEEKSAGRKELPDD